MSLLVGSRGKAPGRSPGRRTKPWKLWLFEVIKSQKIDRSENKFWIILHHTSSPNKQIAISKNTMKDRH